MSFTDEMKWLFYSLRQNLFNIGMYSDIYEFIWSKLMMIDTTKLYILTLVTGVRKSKTFAPSFSPSFRWIQMEFRILLRLVGLVNLLFILSYLFTF